MNRRFEDVDRRFEDINRRFEDMNKRFEDINKRFEQLYTFLWIITGIFTAIMVGAFGFAYWDRRTIIAEAKRQTLEELERDVKPEKLRKLLNVAREFARENEKFREILEKEGLL
jgi:nitrate reductase NapE component